MIAILILQLSADKNCKPGSHLYLHTLPTTTSRVKTQGLESCNQSSNLSFQRSRRNPPQTQARQIHHSHSPCLSRVQSRRSQSLPILKPPLLSLPRRHVYMHPDLDTLLWIRYNGHLTFRMDTSKLDNHPLIPPVQNFAVSVKFWNRITTLPQYAEL